MTVYVVRQKSSGRIVRICRRRKTAQAIVKLAPCTERGDYAIEEHIVA